MGRILTCLAIVCAMVYGTQAYGFDISNTKCYELKSELLECNWFGANSYYVPGDIECVWLPYDNKTGICTKPCHQRSAEECLHYYDSTPGHDFCMLSDDGRCVPNCSKFDGKQTACGKTIGCEYDSTRGTCHGCTTGRYYEAKMKLEGDAACNIKQSRYEDDPPEWECFNAYIIQPGECKLCEDITNFSFAEGVKYEWLKSKTNTIGSCAWKISCSAGFGKVRGWGKEVKCESCEEGQTSEERSFEFVPTGEYEQKEFNICGDLCPKNYYCDGKNGQQPCPKGMITNGLGATSKADCIITKDTQFCDKHGCFTLPLGNGGQIINVSKQTN